MAEQIIDRPVAVVTGASSKGFGEQIVHDLAADETDWYIWALARRGDRLQVLGELAGSGAMECDLTNPEQVAEVSEEILAVTPNIHLLVNNAGMALRGRFGEVDPDDLERAMDTNYHGTRRITDGLRPGLERAAASGRHVDVVNVVSAAAGITNPRSGGYGASKAAQLTLSRCQTVEFRPLGISVHAVHPGKANTEGHPQKPSSSPISRLTRTDIEAVSKAVLGRIGKPSGEVYVPGILRLVATLNAAAPATVGRAVNKLIS